MNSVKIPILSVSMPNFNHGRFLPTRIPSLLAAMPKNSELIIVDDGSTDNSVEIIKQFTLRDQRIKFYQHFQNLGVVASLNEILSVATGMYIAFQSSDDWILPDFFSKMLAFAEQHPNFAVYCSNFGLCNEDVAEGDSSQVRTNFLIPGVKTIQLFPPEKLKRVFFSTGFWIPGHTSIFRTQNVLEFGRFEPCLRHYSDWFLIHGVALRGGVAFLPETLSVLCLSSSSFSSNLSSNIQVQNEAATNIFKILTTPGYEQLCCLFKKSSILRRFIKKRMIFFFLRPKYWGFFLFSFAGWINIRRMRIMKKFGFQKV